MTDRRVFKVMLSGSFSDLQENRKAVLELFPRHDFFELAMEHDAALPTEDKIAASLHKVDEAEAYVCIIGYRYGSREKCPTQNPDNLSLTELEWRRARERNIPRCTLIMSERYTNISKSDLLAQTGADNKRLQAFQKLAESDKVYASFDNDEDLKIKAMQSLGELRRVLDSSDGPQSEPAAAGLLTKLSQWTHAANETFSIVGVKTPLKIDEAWIALTATVREDDDDQAPDLAEALRRYQAWESRAASREARSVDPETLGRFVPRAVIVAGPGMGKSTLLKRIARRYSEDRIPVLKVRLSAVAARMRGGDGFEDAVFRLGLDGSGISPEDARKAGFPDWLLLCDGLDECGKLQERVAEGVARFAMGHPGCRVLVTTRPVGYRAVHFRDWRHYDLPALSPSEADNNAATLLRAIAPPGSQIHDKSREICSRELWGASAAEVIGRTPLLLGLGAGLIARGKSLSATRERLFEQIFALIDEAPNDRIPEPPASPAVLRRFLNILGWELNRHPLAPEQETVKRCAEHLGRELGKPPLAATAAAEKYVGYWRDVGVIERIGDDDLQTLSFIHKSFGEFAAARHLSDMTDADRVQELAVLVKSPSWSEVVRFVGMTSSADLVVDHLLAASSSDEGGAAAVKTALELAGEADPPPNADRRRRIFAAAFIVATDEREASAIKVATPLLAAVRRFPEEAAPVAAGYVSGEYPWTRLVAWMCLVAAGPQHYSVEALVAALPDCAEAVNHGVGRSLGGRAFLRKSIDNQPLTAFFVDACADVIDRASSAVADKIVPEVLNHRNIVNRDIGRDAQVMLHRKGKNYEINYIKRSYENFFPNFNDYAIAQRAQFEAICDALDLPEAMADDDTPYSSPLLHLSAFVAVSEMGEEPVSSVYVWSGPYDRAATRATLRALIDICGVDREKLKGDAAHAKRYLNCDNDDRSDAKLGKSEKSFYDLTVDVDAPDIDWSKAKDLQLDVSLIEAAAHHPTYWIKWISGNLLAHTLAAEQLAATVGRLLATGRGRILWVACGMASALERKVAVSLILERLTLPLVPGCRHLFGWLRKDDFSRPEQLSAVMEAGLLTGDADTAQAAAEFMAQVAAPGWEAMIPLLEQAYAHWLEHEEPYPVGGGVVPTSPRAKLAETLLKLGSPTYEQIKSYLQDARPKVKNIGEGAMTARLAGADGERGRFFNDVATGDLSPNTLRAILKSGLALNGEELEIAESLLSHQDARVRYAAMGLLEIECLPQDKIRKLAEALRGDCEQEIRVRAAAILKKLSPAATTIR
jgi:hypothetical protein